MERIAVVGMAGRFPGADDVEAFWRNLRDGVESISVFSDAQLLAAGVDPAWLKLSGYVKAGGVLENVDLFDAGFFEFSPHEAEVTDPQHRLFLESAYLALEDAGYDLQRCKSRVGVYAGASLSHYLSFEGDRFGSAASYQGLIGNDKDFLTTRVAYKLNLTGPCITVQTACSTSLVAVALACQSLLSYQCDMALAGGVSVRTPQKIGYFSESGGTLSPDGRCCAFDARANGTVVGSGVGVVVLKRLQEAIADGDYIYATICGSAINNDGCGKVGYTAPSVNGQAEAIAEALMMANVEPETISYVEAHGTGTILGDPIEVAALTQAFQTQKQGFCAIGSVKTNIGHLDAAAGVAGLIKTALALKYKLIPPSLNFQQPNGQIDFANSPFYVNTQLKEWHSGNSPRRAGVSSLGMGGTNVHVVLEEAPERLHLQRKHHLLVLSAKSKLALDRATKNLGNYLQQHPQVNLADVAYTLQVGRKQFDYRRILVCGDVEDAVNELSPDLTHNQVMENCPITFMFPGQGAQYADMGTQLYDNEVGFRQQVDACCEILQPYLGLDLRSLFNSAEQLKQTHIAQPVLFVIEYALAKLWMSWGINPESAIGHSIGEYVAACLAGVFSLEDALKLVATRGRLMQQCSTGSMLAISLPQIEVESLLDEQLSLAAINAPSLCVVAGTHDAVDALQAKLHQGINCRRLHVSHAFHSPLMDEILEPFRQQVALVKLHPPKIPFISNVTGTWITADEATEPNYWVKHLRHTVCFSAGIAKLLQVPNRILLEVGPGRTLSTLARQHSQQRVILSSLPHPQAEQSDVACLLNSLGHLWRSGVAIDWDGFYGKNHPQRIPLPTYPFERRRYWRDRSSKPIVQSLWQAVAAASQKEVESSDRQLYIEHKNRLEDLCTAYMNLALRHLGIGDSSAKYALEELLAQVIPRYRQLLCRWLDVLVARGHLQQDGNLYSNLLPLSAPNLVAEAKIQHLGCQQQLKLVQNCGENLAAVLVGDREPLELHFATLVKNGEISRANLPADTYYNSILRSCLEQVVKLLPPKANLRILEIGGGTGIATAELLPLLPPEKTKYIFTDVGSFFLDAAKKKFSDYPFVEYRTLDIEKPLLEQGYLQSFDVVIAVNVLHVTQNLADTLDRVHSLLTPDGLLLMQEITQPQLEFDITDGLLMQPLIDIERSQGNPFLSQQQWQELLGDRGFAKVVASKDVCFGQHIFIAQASSVQKKEVADWFYIPSWQRSVGVLDTDKQKRCWLVFLDDRGLGDRLVQRLQLQGHDIVTVKVGEEFSNTGDRSYTLNPGQKADYNALIKELAALNLLPNAIAHLWNVTDIGKLTITEVSQAQARGFYSLLFLTQALAAQNCSHQLQIKVVSNNMHAVVDESICPQKATIVGLIKVIPQEYPHIHCCSIDITLPASDSWQAEKLTDKLLTELTATSFDKVVAYRGGYRWVQNFLPVSLPASEVPIKQGGVYLIIGGLGSLGLVLAEYLAKYQAKLILVGRSSLSQQNDANSYKIEKIKEIEALGAEIITFTADTANLEQMQNAIAQAENRFGQINGVIHCVATSITERMRRIEQISQVECDREFQAKVYGILVLQQVLQGKQLDFCLLVSSLASIFGGIGHAAYSAANLFLDAFIHHHNQTNPIPWKSANWDGRIPSLPELKVNPELTMTPQDDIEAFNHVLAGEEGQIIVSKRNLQTRIDTWTNNTPTELANTSKHARPNLQTNYIPPRDRLEQDIANIWQQALGITQIGIHDNFFALGGDSLTGVTIINKFQQQLNQNIPISALFTAPTIAELVTHFSQASHLPVLAGKSDREEGEI